MAVTSSLLQSLLDAGCTPEQMVAVAKSEEAKDEAKKEEERIKARDRKRKQRAGHALSHDVTDVTRDIGDKEGFPQTPFQENTPPSPPKGGSSPKRSTRKSGLSAVEETQFMAFWGIYPRLVGRGEAEKSFAKALAIAAFDDIMAGAKRYAAKRQGQDEEFTKHPATWLNQKCWLDGIGASGVYTQQPMRRGQYRIMRNGEVQHRNDEFDDWYQVDVKADAIASIALFDYRQPLEAVG